MSMAAIRPSGPGDSGGKFRYPPCRPSRPGLPSGAGSATQHSGSAPLESRAHDYPTTGPGSFILSVLACRWSILFRFRMQVGRELADGALLPLVCVPCGGLLAIH